MALETLLSKEEAAKYLRCSDQSFPAWISRGRLRPTKVGSKNFFTERELERFVRESTQAAEAKRKRPVVPESAREQEGKAA